MSEHWFWLVLMIAVMAWYSATTVYVGVRGILDIKQMLRRLEERHDQSSSSSSEPPAGRN